MGLGKKIFRIQWRRIVFHALIFVYVCLVLFALLNKNSRVKYNMPKRHSVSVSSAKNICEVNTEKFGTVDLELDFSSVVQKMKAEQWYRSVSNGGIWKPKGCNPQQRLAVLIPHRNRKTHLMLLLNRLHGLLQKQKLQYHIFVIEQSGNEEFNRGRLLNIGANEAMKNGKFDCFVFHDVDLIPEHDGNFYMCDDQLRHLASAIDEMRYHVMYYNYVGGVVAVNKDNLLAINGYSNNFWGWGSEDDDFSARSIGAGLLLTRPPESIGKYKMVRHNKQWRSDNGYDMFLTWRSRWKLDGLNNIEQKYKKMTETYSPLYTNITVDAGKPDDVNQRDYINMPRETFWWFLQFFIP